MSILLGFPDETGQESINSLRQYVTMQYCVVYGSARDRRAVMQLIGFYELSRSNLHRLT
jgi:hypothetical protein